MLKSPHGSWEGSEEERLLLPSIDTEWHDRLEPQFVSFPENEKRERESSSERNPTENPCALTLTGLSCKFPFCKLQRAPSQPPSWGCPDAAA